MTQNKISYGRAAELVGIVELHCGFPETKTPRYKLLGGMWTGNCFPDFFTDPAWTGLVLERLREKCKGKYKLEVVFNSLGTCFVARSTLSAELVYHQHDESINTAIITALDALDKEPK